MRYETYKLFQLVENFDDYGNSKNDFEFLENISVHINEQHIKVLGTETCYFVKALQGVTPYDKFELGAEYMISNFSHEYKIISFINGRLAQLILEEVKV
ncbi:hypothetical protein [Anaerotignum propionicum]|uniref:Uncharacterized protein n=1 Tax=Anaerotignum propionicum DSM 1682 TaxID=991789 RepID=A0A0X8VB38_ANAPI|nr:hypothetical protein [Anaerotignum propionicum]AMJ42331.1 hypothetical protein CPRO_27850 [Anaerotignum propionicum DSM 1682]SHE99697.1 hypothetical protein SAMN02745151_02441 [[Clostridium] propionicum DSM 1682] [Anaerotignum propionicum DSM 1682]